MKYLEELILVYPGKDRQTQKFVLAQALDHVPDPSSGDVAALLWRELHARESIVRRQARYVLGQYLPRQAEQSFGLYKGTVGVWSVFVKEARGVDLDAAARPPAAVVAPRVAAQLLQSAGHVLAEPIQRAHELFTSGSVEERTLASLALGRLCLPSTRQSLTALVSGDDVNFAAALALADLGGPGARAAILESVRRHGASRPDLYMLLRGFPDAEVLETLAAEESRTNPFGRSNIALALASHTFRTTGELLARLIRRKEGWVTVYALDALAGYGDPAALELIKEAFRLETHEFVRVQAVRSAGSIFSGAAAEFCLTQVKGPSGRIQALALESLARQGLTPAELVQVARPLLQSDFLRTRIHAILITATHDPEWASDEIAELILSADALLRLEGAYVLGYLQVPGSLELLARMAHEDPSASVRTQAIKSIGRFDPDDALPVLQKLLAVSDPASVAAACRALTALPVAVAGVVLEALSRAYARATDARCQAPIAACLGTVAGTSDRPPPEALGEAIRKGPLEVQLAALDGAKCLGNHLPAGFLPGDSPQADPRIRARSALAAFASGDTSGLASLAGLLGSRASGASQAMITATLEAGLVVPLVADNQRFTRLVGALRGHMRSESYQAFVRTQPEKASLPEFATLAPRQAIAELEPPAVKQAPRNLAERGSKGLGSRYRPEALAAAPTGALLSAHVAQKLGLGDGDRLAGARSLLDSLLDAIGKARQLPPVLLLAVPGILALAVIAWNVMGRATAPGDGPGPVRWADKSALQIVTVTGTCSYRGGPSVGPSVKANDMVKAGGELATGPQSAVSLLDRVGNMISLGAESSVRIARVAAVDRYPRETRFLLQGPKGQCMFDFKESPEALIEIGAVTLTLSRGAARITETGSGCQVELTAGEGQVAQPGQPARPLKLREPLDLGAAAGAH